MIVAMVGFPGTGKSYLAKALAQHRSIIILDKDIVRSALFPGELTDFSAAQDDLCIDIILQVAKYHLDKDRQATIIIDGRPFSHQAQVDALCQKVGKLGTPLKFIECSCSDETARERIVAGRSSHLAKNRDFDLYLKHKREADPLLVEHLSIETDKLSLEESVAKALAYLDGH